MELKIKDLVELLNISEKTLYQWIKSGKIPVYKINNQYRFNKAEIHDWVLRNNIAVSEKVMSLFHDRHTVDMVALLNAGGIFHKIKGDNIGAVLRSAVDVMALPDDVSKDALLGSLLAREDLMPTAVGKGIAIPHPRNPIVTEIEHERIALCFLEEPIDFKALDGEPVHTIFVTLSATPKRHLELLSKISCLCQLEPFATMLSQQASKEDILSFVTEKEQEWSRRDSHND